MLEIGGEVSSGRDCKVGGECGERDDLSFLELL
jgi:hypothetical protein